MDNFIDTLARRFNAGELIRANGEAEARENQRLKEQTAEYNKIMQEIRRLNLKTVELSEQVSQMVACAVEQFEAYAAKEVLADEDEQEQEKQAVLQQLLQEREEQAALGQLMQEQADKAALQEQLLQQQREQLTAISKELQACETRLQKGVTDSMYRIEASVSQTEAEMAQNRQALDASLQTLERNLGARMAEQKDDSTLLEAVSETLSQNAQAEQESAKQIKEMIVNIRLYLDEMQKHIEDYVHKEDVKVYRNVQAVLMEQMSAKTRDLNDHMDQIEQSVVKTKGTKLLILLTLFVSAASVALQVLQIVGIL